MSSIEPSVNYTLVNWQNQNQSQTQQETKNSGNIADRKNAGVIIDGKSTSADISYTQVLDRDTWNYKSESDSPSLRSPVSTTYGAGPAVQENTGNVEENYKLLHDQLPEDLKAGMKDYPSPLTVGLEDLLKIVAGGVVWQEGVKVLLSSENATNRMGANLRYPDGSFANTVASGREFVESALKLLQEIGPNDPNYLEVKGFVDSVNVDLSEVKDHKDDN